MFSEVRGFCAGGIKLSTGSQLRYRNLLSVYGVCNSYFNLDLPLEEVESRCNHQEKLDYSLLARLHARVSGIRNI